MPITVHSTNESRPCTVTYRTVAELVEYLSYLPGNVPIGFVGHFGELHPLDFRDIYVRTSERIAHLYTGAETHPFTSVSFPIPDIGEEPT